MNIINSILGYSPNAEKLLVTISPGEFSIVRPIDSPKGRRELIYKEAEISLVKTTREFFVNIQVQDLNSDKGDKDELVDLINEGDSTYLVHSDLKLGYYLKDGRTAITWRDLEGENGERFEFLCAESVSKASLDKFDRCVCEAQYGQKFGSAKVDKSILESMTINYKSEELVKVENASEKVEADQSETSNEESENAQSARPLLSSKNTPTQGRIMVKSQADFCNFDMENHYFVMWDDLADAETVVIDAGDYKYVLEARKNGTVLISVNIDESFSPYIDVANNALIFNALSEETGEAETNLFRFNETDDLKAFDSIVTVAKYEAMHKQRWESLDGNAQDFLIDAMSNMNIDDDDHKEEYMDYNSDESDDQRDDIDDEEVDQSDEFGSLGHHDINSALEVGHTNDRTFVVRGDKIGVFKNSDRALQYSTTIQGLNFDPSKIMLHEQDQSLILQSQENSKSLYRMDLETGKIVDEWKTGKDIADFNPVSKFAQTTAEKNLFGVSDQSMFRIDPRINGGRVSASAEKLYKTKNLGLSCIVTTEAGWIVVGNDKGEIRLFDELGHNAKTLIPGLGDPIVGLDVSSDGKFVLVTCAKYLLLVETMNRDNNGFKMKWLKDSRPMPRKLEISPENIAYMWQSSNKPVSFTPAKFNMSTNKKETTIVTSTGPYLVTWSLSELLKGNRDSYRIKVYDGKITANNFKFGTDQRVILSLEDNVNIVAKSALKKPSDIFNNGKTETKVKPETKPRRA